jgi:hypothetical protein
MGVTNVSFDSKYETSATWDTDAEAGDGGGSMAAWTSPRKEAVPTLVTSDYKNNSDYKVPASVVDTKGWDNDPFSNPDYEKANSVAVEGVITDPDDDPMTGRAYLREGETDLASVDGSGSLVVSARAPDGVTSGEDKESLTIDFVFEPSADALNYVEEDVVGDGNSVYQVQYGGIEGTIIDYNGDPVMNDTIKAPGAYTSTDENGEYEFSAPGGTEVTLEVLRGTTEVTATPSGGEMVTEDYQYAGLEVSIQIPDGTGLPGIKVAPDAAKKVKQTGEDGKATFVQVVDNGDIEIEVSEGKFTLSVAFPGLGSLATVTETVGFGLEGEVYDGQGNAAGGVDVTTDIDNPLVSEVRPDGSFTVGDVETGQISLIIGSEDDRYIQSEEKVSVDDGDVISGIKLTLERDVPIGNSI